jgi:Protein of unknown function (DUF1552)
MMFITQRHISRRTALKGIGATVALPLLDAMIPAARALAAPRPAVRLVCVEMVHGSAGSTQFGAARNLWAPAAIGTDFDLRPTSLASLEPFRDYLTVVSNTDVPSADPFSVREIGGDHFRSSACFLTQAHPKQTAGADIEVATSLDQLYAQRFGQETPIPSMQLCIENVDQGGGCGHGYSCVYTDTLSWASPTRPLPMIRNPRVVFDEMFGVFGSGASLEERRVRRQDDRSILDWLGSAISRLKLELGATDRGRLDDYLGNIREIERRLRAVEAGNGTGEPRELPGGPRGVPDSFSTHVQLMFDLQALAFASDITRVFSFKLGRDNSNRTYPESGTNGAFHPTSHHGEKEDRILEFAKLNAYHVSMIPYFLERLRATPDADGTLLDHTILLYGSPMGDSNLHDHKRVPFFLAGRAGGAVNGGRHLKAADGTPLSNVMLGLLHALGLNDVESFGDSDGGFDLNT